MNDEHYENPDHPPFEPGQDFELDVLRLVAAVREHLRAPTENSKRTMTAALEDVDAWFEDDDPRSMGWVDDKGRP